MSSLITSLTHPTSAASSKQILIVEDDEKFQHIMQSKLAHHQSVITIVDTVDKAEASIAETKPDLILLDMMLPGGKNGFDLLEILKSNEDTKAIPVIVLTNLPEEEQRTAIELGAAGFFVKAENKINDVVATVEQCLSSQ